MLERAIVSARADRSVAELQALAGEAASEALGRVNRRARGLQREDASKAGASERMNFGVYFYRAAVNGDGDGERAAQSSPAAEADSQGESDAG